MAVKHFLKPIILFVVLACTITPSIAQDKQQNVPDVLILIQASPMPPNTAFIYYNSIVDDKTVKSDIETLLKTPDWQASNLMVSSEPDSKVTSAEFLVAGPVDWQKGTLFIEPFILTFKRFDFIQVQFTLDGEFPFRSLRNYSDKHVNIEWFEGNSTPSYIIKLKDHNFDKLNLPLVVKPPQEAADSSPNPKSGRRGGNLVLALLIALLAGAIVFTVVGLATRKRKE